MDLSVGKAGSTHDSTVWVLSPLALRLEAEPDQDGYRDYIPPGGYIVGDGAYVETPYLLTPVAAAVVAADCSSAASRWTLGMRAARRCTERAFGVFKRIFKLLASSMSDIDYILKCDLCVAAAVLHNMRRRALVAANAAEIDDAELDRFRHAAEADEREMAFLYSESGWTTSAAVRKARAVEEWDA